MEDMQKEPQKEALYLTDEQDKSSVLNISEYYYYYYYYYSYPYYVFVSLSSSLFLWSFRFL